MGASFTFCSRHLTFAHLSLLLTSKETLNHCSKARVHRLEACETTQAGCLSYIVQLPQTSNT